MGCLSSDSRRRCLAFSRGLAARGTNWLYHESSYMVEKEWPGWWRWTLAVLCGGHGHHHGAARLVACMVVGLSELVLIQVYTRLLRLQPSPSLFTPLSTPKLLLSCPDLEKCSPEHCLSNDFNSGIPTHIPHRSSEEITSSTR